MDSALGLHRFHFAFTITFHYLFVQLTLGLALLLFLFKTVVFRTGDPRYHESVRFWSRIFAINFALGVVTGLPMEFQFGTNWSAFSRAAGGVIGHTLGMEGLYSFFLESSFLGLLLYGDRLLGRVGHWLSAAAVWIGSWLSAYLIVATDAWMQHPQGYALGPNGEIYLQSWWALVFNQWAFWQFWHAVLAGVVTAAGVVSAMGAFYLLLGRHEDQARLYVKWGVVAGLVAALLVGFPTGDSQGSLVAKHQPATLAAMEGRFSTAQAAPVAIMGQPDVDRRRLDNPLEVPGLLSFIVHRRWEAEVRGLEAFPRQDWPDNMPLLYYSFHIMVGLGTLLIALFGLSVLLLWRGLLERSRWMLWCLLLAMPLPYIANTAGWMTAEMGRQPWLIYGLMRTSAGVSARVSSGSALFSLLGFMGLYSVLFMLGLFLIWREIDAGPGARSGAGH